MDKIPRVQPEILYVLLDHITLKELFIPSSSVKIRGRKVKEIFKKCNEIPKAVFKLDLQNESHHQASVLESHPQLPEELFFG